MARSDTVGYNFFSEKNRGAYWRVLGEGPPWSEMGAAEPSTGGCPPSEMESSEAGRGGWSSQTLPPSPRARWRRKFGLWEGLRSVRCSEVTNNNVSNIGLYTICAPSARH